MPPLPAKVTGCAMLTGGTATCSQTVAGVDIMLTGNPDTVDTIVSLSLDSPAAEIAPIPTAVTSKAGDGKANGGT
jgi:hypothetical protein